MTVIIDTKEKIMNCNTVDCKRIARTLDAASRAELWVQALDNRVDLPEPMEQPIREQARRTNYPKPIGLYFGDDELIKRQDEGFHDTERDIVKKKQESLCESFHYFARVVPAKQILDRSDQRGPEYDLVPRNVVTPTVARILQTSAIPQRKEQSGVGELEQDVEEHFDWFLLNRNEQPIRKILENHP